MVFFDDEVRFFLERFMERSSMGFSNVFPISCLFLSQLNGKHTISTHSYYGVISFVFSRL